MWIPLEFWDEGGDGVRGEGGPRGGDVRGEKVLEEAELEDELALEYGDGDGDGEMEMEVYGVRDMLQWVWRKVEKIGLLVQREKQQVGKCKELDDDDGHDGDL